jgi:type I restriction enzyme S subunit
MKQKESLKHKLDGLKDYTEKKSVASAQSEKIRDADKKQGWEIKKLGEVSDILNGGTPKTNIAEYWDGDIHWITPADLGKLTKPTVDDTPRKITRIGLEKSSAKLFPENSVILSTRAPIGHLAINEVPMSTNQGCRGIVPSQKLATWFLYYFLKKNVELLDSLGTGATFKELSTKALAGVKIPLPPLPEQQRIVSILDECFAAIDKAKANAEQNLKNAKALFESYLQGVFENKGEGWEERKVNEIGNAQTGTTPKTIEKENYGDFIPFIKPADVDFLGIGVIRYDNEGLSEIGLKKGRKIESGSILMVCIGATIGKVGFAEREVSCNQQINSLTVKKAFEPKFIYYAMTSKEFQEKVLLEGKGAQATLPIINKSKWENLTISFPKSKETQQTIVRQLDALRAETQKLEAVYEKKIADLEELKKSILQKAFAGELRSPEEPVPNLIREAVSANDGYSPSETK